MKSPEEILKLQRLLSNASGVRQIAGWLMIAAAVLAAVSVIVALRSKESVLGSIVPLLMMFTSGALLRSSSKKRVRELEVALHR